MLNTFKMFRMSKFQIVRETREVRISRSGMFNVCLKGRMLDTLFAGWLFGGLVVAQPCIHTPETLVFLGSQSSRGREG